MLMEAIVFILEKNPKENQKNPPKQNQIATQLHLL